MKKIIFYTLTISIFAFSSCEKKKDAEPLPVIPTLKGFNTESTSPSRTVKSAYLLVYANNKLNNLQRVDTIKEDGEPVRIGPVLNNILTEEGSEGFKLVSDFGIGGANGYTISKVENVAQKTLNGYDITTTCSSSQTVYYSQLELNKDNQVIKNTVTKFVTTDKNGVKRETPQNIYNRYEYDSNGNIIKAFLKDISSAPEVLIGEYTYDNKPCPYKDLKWMFRLLGAGFESKNNILTSKNYQQGVLLTETTGLYTYDTQTSYPLILTVSGKSFSPNVGVGSSKTFYKY